MRKVLKPEPAKKTAPPKPVEQPPDVQPGDSVYFSHPENGPMYGAVVCKGVHGMKVRDDGGTHHDVHWDRFLGHRQRMQKRFNIIDHGEDGAIAHDEDGKKVFVRGQIPDPSGDEMPTFEKALFFKAMDKSKLQQKTITDKNGVQSKRWVSNGQPPPVHPVGTHVKFQMGSMAGQGHVTAAGKHGGHVKDETGFEHKVKWGQVTHHEQDGPADGEQAPDKFDAAAFAKLHDQADVSVASVLAGFPEDTKAKIDNVEAKLKGVKPTIELFKKDGKYTPERLALHQTIIDKFLSPEKIAAARPADGTPPSFTILGGRGGSGKSSFKNTVYDPGKAVVLDADEIKHMLPEYKGWNAFEVHDESGDLFDKITDLAKTNGLNIVHDATMKTPDKAVSLVHGFKSSGYSVAAHYMHLPRQEAAKRAVGRFLGGGNEGRYVPVDVVLGNTKNEQSFDAIKPLVDAWSFRDNNVPRGQPPKLIAQSKGKTTAAPAGKPMHKALDGAIIVFQRTKP